MKDMARAHQFRSARARILERIREGQLDPAKTLMGPPVAIKGLDVYDYLLACPGVGRETARHILEGSHVWPHLMIDELTAEMKKRIVENMPERVI